MKLAPRAFITDFHGLSVAAAHGSPRRYDTPVPVVFATHGLAAVRIPRLATPAIAPTLVADSDINPPSHLRSALFDLYERSPASATSTGSISTYASRDSAHRR